MVSGLGPDSSIYRHSGGVNVMWLPEDTHISMLNNTAQSGVSPRSGAVCPTGTWRNGECPRVAANQGPLYSYAPMDQGAVRSVPSVSVVYWSERS